MSEHKGFVTDTETMARMASEMEMETLLKNIENIRITVEHFSDYLELLRAELMKRQKEEFKDE